MPHVSGNRLGSLPSSIAPAFPRSSSPPTSIRRSTGGSRSAIAVIGDGCSASPLGSRGTRSRVRHPQLRSHPHPDRCAPSTARAVARRRDVLALPVFTPPVAARPRRAAGSQLSGAAASGPVTLATVAAYSPPSEEAAWRGGSSTSSASRSAAACERLTLRRAPSVRATDRQQPGRSLQSS
jgi:hypothetical protein